jgi:hypothetical protein
MSIKAFKRTNNSWLFVRASLILANYHLPLNVALCVQRFKLKIILRFGILTISIALK